MGHFIALLSLGLALVGCGSGLPGEAPEPTAVPPIRVGDCLQGGVVFYLNDAASPPAGQRGLVVALSNVAGTFTWQSGATAVPGTSTNLFTGAANTAAILATLPGDSPAAQAAHDYTDGSYSDWHLPSRDELSTLAVQSRNLTTLFTACGGTDLPEVYYWSSSQYATPANAWYTQLSGGDSAGVVSATANGSPGMGVRPIRAF